MHTGNGDICVCVRVLVSDYQRFRDRYGAGTVHSPSPGDGASWSAARQVDRPARVPTIRVFVSSCINGLKTYNLLHSVFSGHVKQGGHRGTRASLVHVSVRHVTMLVHFAWTRTSAKYRQKQASKQANASSHGKSLYCFRNGTLMLLKSKLMLMKRKNQ